MLIHGCSLFSVYVKMDLNGDGCLDFEEFRTSMKYFCLKTYTESECRMFIDIFYNNRLYKSYDASGNGDMSIDEFYNIMRPLILNDFYLKEPIQNQTAWLN